MVDIRILSEKQKFQSPRKRNRMREVGQPEEHRYTLFLVFVFHFHFAASVCVSVCVCVHVCVCVCCAWVHVCVFGYYKQEQSLEKYTRN
jgi:hypothetical protein